MAIRAEINKTAVNPLTDAYIGGKNDKGSTFGSRTLNKSATTIETGIYFSWHLIYFSSPNNFKISSFNAEISSDSPSSLN
jgi:hypothetical protein